MINQIMMKVVNPIGRGDDLSNIVTGDVLSIGKRKELVTQGLDSDDIISTCLRKNRSTIGIRTYILDTDSEGPYIDVAYAIEICDGGAKIDTDGANTDNSKEVMGEYATYDKKLIEAGL